MNYPIIVEVDFEAEDEVDLTHFINYLIQFECRKVRVRRIYSLKEAIEDGN